MLSCCSAAISPEDQLALLLGELKRIEGQQTTLQTAVKQNKAIVVIPRKEVSTSRPSAAKRWLRFRTARLRLSVCLIYHVHQVPRAASHSMDYLCSLGIGARVLI